MKVYKLLTLAYALFILIGCGSDNDDDDKGDNSGRLEITLDDDRGHRTLNTVFYSYSGKDIINQLDPGEAGKGVTWDFSGLDLSKYDYKMKSVMKGRKVEYATSTYKDDFPDATECYIVAHNNTHPDDNSVVGLYDYYTYYDGNKEYGSVQEDLGSTVSIWQNIPALEMAYPHYFGLKFTEKTQVALKGSDYSFLHHVEIEIDGEGTLILPNGDKFTDVLRYKLTQHTEDRTIVSYSFCSKKASDILNMSKENNYLNYVDEWE